MASQQPYWAGSTPVDEATLMQPAPTGLRETPAAPAAPAATGNFTTKPAPAPAPRNPEALMTREEKIAEGISGEKLEWPYRWDENRRPVLPAGYGTGEGKKDDSELTAGDVRRSNTIKAITGEVRRLYEQDIKGQPLTRALGATEYIDVLPKNERFSAAGSNILPLIRPLVAQTAKEGDSDKEMTVFQSYTPSADDSDLTIESKLGMLDALVGGMVDGKSPSQLLAEMGLQPGQLPEAAGGEQAATKDEPSGPPSLAFSTGADGKVVHNVESTGGAVASDTGLIGEEGGTHTEADPRLTGTNATIKAMIMRHEAPEKMVEYLKGKGMSPDAIAYANSMVQDIREWEQTNKTKWNGTVDLERMDVPNTTLQNVVGSDVGAGAAGYADALSAFNIDSAASMLGKNPEEVRAALAASQAAHPTSTAIGNVAGGVTAALGGEALAAKAGLGAMPAVLAGDIAYGGAAGAGATDYNPETGAPATAADRALGAVKGAAAAGVSSATGLGVTGVGRGLARPAADEAVAAVNKMEIPTTVGQQYGKSGFLGGMLKRTEDKIMSLAYVGDMIHARRVEGIKKFNTAVYNHVLEPLGIKMGDRLGDDAIAFAEQEVSKQFGKALNGKRVKPDEDFGNEFSTAIGKLGGIERVGPELKSSIQELTDAYMSGSRLSGEDMQIMSREIRDMKAAYFKAADPQAKRIGKALDGVEDSIFGLFRRQTPDVMPDYNKAKMAYKRLNVAAKAVNAAKNKEGIFMPSQLGNIDKAEAVKQIGHIKTAGGGSEFHDLHEAAQSVLPSEYPDSGTAGRLFIPGLALTATAGTGAGEATGYLDKGATGKLLTFAGLLGAAYSKSGQRILTKPGRGATGAVGRGVGWVGEKATRPVTHGLTAEVARERKAEEEKARPKAKAR